MELNFIFVEMINSSYKYYTAQLKYWAGDKKERDVTTNFPFKESVAVPECLFSHISVLKLIHRHALCSC